MTPKDQYLQGYTTGVADAHSGITEPEGGYPDNETFRGGLAHGRADYERRRDSFMTGEPMTGEPKDSYSAPTSCAWCGEPQARRRVALSDGGSEMVEVEE